MIYMTLMNNIIRREKTNKQTNEIKNDIAYVSNNNK